MKLASLKEGGRDGTLIVVDRDAEARGAGRPASRRPCRRRSTTGPTPRRKLRALAEQLADDKAPGSFELDTTALAAPLPRAYQWADGSAYVVHVELVRKARGVEMPPSLLDRSADVPGRLGLLHRPDRRHRGRSTRPGASISRARSA